jgi:hypothetical protein
MLTFAGLQLLYFLAYGPTSHPGFSSWNLNLELPMKEFEDVPAGLRRAVFWFFIDGDFLFWGGLFAWAALRRRSRALPDSEPSGPLRTFLWQWRWYFAVCGLMFLGINFYRYSFDWGDSNKFVLFLNFGLTMVIVLGVAGLRGGPSRIWARILWLFFFVLCIAPPSYRLVASVLAEPYGSVLLLTGDERAAARWLRSSTRPSDVVLTGAYGYIHFVSSLAGRPVLAGLYGDSSPYRQDDRREEIRRIYEEGDLRALRKLGPQFVCISRYERDRYKLHPCWQEFIKKPGVLVFQATSEDCYAVYILDARRLLELDSAGSFETTKQQSQGSAQPVAATVSGEHH